MLAVHAFNLLPVDDEKPTRKANPAFNRLVHAYVGRPKLPFLTRAEEYELVSLVQDQDCPESMSLLIEHHLGFLVNIANRCAELNNLQDHTEDLYNEAAEGFMRAVKKFDNRHQARLSTLAKHYVAASCYRYVMDMKHIFRVGTNLESKKAFYNMSRIRRDFMEVFQRPMTSSQEDIERAEMLSNISAAAIRRQMEIEASAQTYSPDEIEIHELGGAIRGERKLARETGGSLLRRHIDRVAESLIDRDRDILLTVIQNHERKSEFVTLVAQKHGITVERVRQIVRAGLASIRASLNSAGVHRSADLA